MPTTATLSLGTRKDAKYWIKECENQLGYNSNVKITDPNPSMRSIEEFFLSSDEWLFFGGHFDETDHLYNENGSIKIKFHKDKIVVNHGSTTETLVKKKEFKQHEKVKVIFWGGCNVHSNDKIRENIRELFDNPLMIGWRSLTGWQVLYSVMGGSGNLPPQSSLDFFDRVKNSPEKEQVVKDAWLDTARDTQWGSSKPKFSVYDSKGNEFVI